MLVAPPAPLTSAERSLAPDIARGAMLLFIALANVTYYQWGRPLDDYGNIADASTADRVAHFVEQLLIAERSRPMFAILYGFGIAVMASRMTARGLEPLGVRRVLRRRSWVLVVLGIVHAGLLFGGDILGAYGVTGLIALGLVLLPEKPMRRWFWGSLVYVALGATTLLALLVSYGGGEQMPTDGAHPVGPSYAMNVLYGLSLEVAVLLLSSLFLAFLPLVIAGFELQRRGWLNHPQDHLPGLRRVFATGMVVNVLSSLPAALVALGVLEPGRVGAFAAAYLTLLGGMYAGLGYICGFALLAHRWAGRGRRGAPGALAALGERSLTGYLGQSILMAPLLAPWGFALGDGLGSLGAYGVAAGAWAATVLAAVLMARRGARGPFEVLVRRLTYGRAAGTATGREGGTVGRPGTTM